MTVLKKFEGPSIYDFIVSELPKYCRHSLASSPNAINVDIGQ